MPSWWPFGRNRITSNIVSWFSSKVSSGVKVTQSTALNYSAVWAATLVISDSIASLPMSLYQKRRDGGRDKLTDDPMYDMVHGQPNGYQDSMTFFSSLIPDLLNRGNAFAFIDRDPNGNPVALIPIPAAIVNIKLGSPVEYDVTIDGKVVTLYADSILHITGAMPDDLIVGKGIVTQARESIGMGLATEQFGAAFFGNGATPGGFLERPKDAPPLSQEAAKRLMREFIKGHSGPNNTGKLGMLQEGMTFKPAIVPPEDAQFLETRQFNVTEIARWYRVPPHKIGDLTRSTFSNITQENLSFVTDSLRPWVVRIERAMTTQLLTASQRAAGLYVEFNLDALLRGDPETRAKYLAKQWEHGAVTTNEWRMIENRQRTENENADKAFVPLNFVPVDKVGTETEKPESGDLMRQKRQRLLVATLESCLARERGYRERNRTDEELAAWYEKHAEYMREKLTPVLDVLDLNEDAAELAEAIAREHIEKSLSTPVCEWIGRANKTATLVLGV